MNSVPELLTASNRYCSTYSYRIRHVGVIDSLDDCNRRSSFKDPFSAVDANSNAILSFSCIYEYRSLPRGNIDPASLCYHDHDSSGAVLRYTYIENTKWALHMAVLN